METAGSFPLSVPCAVIRKRFKNNLAGAGNEDAKRMIGVLGAGDELLQKSRKENSGKSPLTPEDLKAVMAGAALAVEARYEALSRFMRTEGYTSLLDIACGYTPRALYCGREGIDYVGLDVPASWKAGS